MYTRPRNVEGYSSTELSECESQSTSSDVSTPPPKSKKSLRPRKTSKDAQSRSSRRKRREHTARQKSARLRKIASRNYAESSSSESESISPKATRGKKKDQVSRRNSTKHKHALDKRRYTKRANKKEILRPSPHVARDEFCEEDLNIQQHQFLNTEKSSNFSGIEKFQKGPYMPQVVTYRQQQQFLQQENSVTSDVKGIDPNLLKLKFSGAEAFDWTHPLPPDPILLSVGKPIWIPIWEIRDFQPCNTLHEESSDLALSDFEGEIHMATTSKRGSRTEKQGTKYSSSEKKEKHPYRKRQQSTTDAKPPYRVAKIRPRRAYPTSKSIRTLPPIPEVPPHIPSLSHHALLHLRSLSQPQPQPQLQLQPLTTTTNNNNLHRSRFLLLMHLYWEQNPTLGLTASLNREYEGEEGAPWTVAQVEQMLEQSMADPRLEAYRRRWEDARVFKETVVLDEEDGGGESKGGKEGSEE